MRDRDSFHVERMLRLGSVSKVATALCKWVHAMISYAQMNRKSEMFEKDKEYNSKRFENISSVDTKWKAFEINYSEYS